MSDDMMSPQPLSIEPLRRDRITAISSAVQRRPIVLVLGMHRSGTSLCSHILSALGVDMADKIPGPGATSPHPSNPRGHWERWEIVEFHDRILGLFNRDYLGHFHDFALPVAWWADPRVVQIRREIVAFLEQRMGSEYFGFKDPRTVRLMPVWHQILSELKLAPKIVLCLRNPAQIGRSLSVRDGLDPEIGEYRWLVHIVDFFRYTKNFDFCTVEYEEWFSNPSVNLEKLQKFLDLQWQQSEADLALVLSGIIDPSARHDDSDHREAGQPLVRTLYKLASRGGQDAEARDQISYIVSQFVGFQQLQSPFLQVFEEVAKVAAKYPDIEREAASLRAAVGERDALVEAADGRAVTVEGRLAEAFAQIEQQQAQIAALATERDEARGLKATLEERETALQAAQAEAAAREAALERAEREAQEHAAETAATRDEIAALELKAAERRAAAATLEAAVEVLRKTLAQADRQAQERAAAAEALRAEIATLNDTLAAARQVGMAAISAFRMETAAPAKLVTPRGWRRHVMRFFSAGPSH
jgi:Sulfotransferase family